MTRGATSGWTRRRVLLAGAGTLIAARAPAVLASSRPLYVDGLLSSLPQTDADIRASKLDAFLCDVSDVEEIRDPDGALRYARTFATCDRALDSALAQIRENLKSAYVAARGSQIARDAGTAIFLQFQSCEPIGSDLSRISYFHGKGLRALQFTHHGNNLFAGGSIEPTQTGLTPLGVEGLAEMNRLGVLADISHASDPTSLDVARYARKPFVLSHGACRALVDHPRCAPDSVIRAIADRGGVMGVFMMSFWLTTDAVPTVEHYVAQLRHVIQVGGIEAAGVANDFTIAGEMAVRAVGNDNARGVQNYLDWWKPLQARGMPGFAKLPQHVVIPELNTIERMELIQRALERSGCTSTQIEKVMGGNWKRVLTDVLG